MKKIEAIIRKSKFKEVQDALHENGIDFFSYWDVTGVGRATEGHIYRGTVYSTSYIQRTLLSIIVSDTFEQIAVDTILKIARTGDVGDGKIFVSDITESYRIRTGEKGPSSYNITDV